MSKDIWHTADETPKPYEDIAFYVDGYLYSSYYEAQHNQYGIFGADKVERWGYIKDLSSYIPALESDLERTRKALDATVDVVKEIDELLSSNRFDVKETPLLNITQTKISMLLRCINIAEITALEQKEPR